MVLEMRKMKDSGIEWIGEIPEGWEVAPLKRFTSIQTGNTPSKTSDSNYYASTGIPWIKPDNLGYSHSISKTSEHLTSEGALCARIMPPNTVYVCCIGSLGKVGYSSISCACNQQINALIFNDLMFWKYGYYLTIAQESQYLLFGNGNVLQIINSTSQGNIACVLPPLENQHLIACYLDSVCSDIEVLISKTRSSIEEYKKLKQAVITQAVTKGVRGEREMKDSGVEWIGEIPKEWRKTQLRHCATIKSGITLGKSYRKDTVLIERPYLRVTNVQGGYVDLNDLATIEVTPDEDLKYRLHSGDVLMTEGGDRDKLGRGCVWHGEIEPCLHQNHVFAVQTNETILLPEFLEYLTASDVGRSYFDVTAIKTTNLACTSSSKVLAFTIPLPPIEEQIEIVSFIKKRSLELNKLIMKKELLVQELESYKKSLIYEVVTGKLEV